MVTLSLYTYKAFQFGFIDHCLVVVDMICLTHSTFFYLLTFCTSACTNVYILSRHLAIEPCFLDNFQRSMDSCLVACLGPRVFFIIVSRAWNPV